MAVDWEALLEWYRPRRRRYPWRGTKPDPYRVLVSEVMLQQTQAARVAPAFARFVRRFPSVEALAAASVGDVIREWAGLGYNRRAVALSRAARAVVADHRGRIPADPAELRTLPGVGPYTASAVASMGFGLPVAAVDTNVRRVVARACLGREPGVVGTREMARAAGEALSRTRPGDWNQAVMDLGREVCRPVPRCGGCPVRRGCRSGTRLVKAPPRRKSERFEGSTRQLRGRVVAELRAQRVTASFLAKLLGQSPARMGAILEELSGEGLVVIDDGMVGLFEDGRCP